MGWELGRAFSRLVRESGDRCGTCGIQISTAALSWPLPTHLDGFVSVSTNRGDGPERGGWVTGAQPSCG